MSRPTLDLTIRFDGTMTFSVVMGFRALGAARTLASNTPKSRLSHSDPGAPGFVPAAPGFRADSPDLPSMPTLRALHCKPVLSCFLDKHFMLRAVKRPFGVV